MWMLGSWRIDIVLSHGHYCRAARGGRHSFTDLSHSAEPPIRTIAPTLVMGCSLPQYAPNNTNVNTRPPSLVVYFLSFARNVWRGQPLVINIIFKCIEEIYRKVPPGWLAWLISLLCFTRIFDWGILLRGPEAGAGAGGGPRTRFIRGNWASFAVTGVNTPIPSLALLLLLARWSIADKSVLWPLVLGLLAVLNIYTKVNLAYRTFTI